MSVNPKDLPHYHGHRDRLREKFATYPDSLSDAELLELLLFTAIPRRDTKPIAKRLLTAFETLPQVFAADHKNLQKIEGISRSTAVFLKVIAATNVRNLRNDIINKPILSNWQRLEQYCLTAMKGQTTEQFRVLYLNSKNELIADEIQQKGTVNHAPVYPRETIKRALDLGATAIILAHNHPSGDPTPSRDDIEITKKIKEAAQAFDIALHDHLVIGSYDVYSFKSNGLL